MSKIDSLKTFDVADFLDSEETMQAYFSQVVQDGDSEEIIAALSHIAKARGMAQLAKDTGLGRESLYKSMAHGAMPRFDTVLKIVRALNLKFTPVGAG
jgi:probable addiction module antidote protein